MGFCMVLNMNSVGIPGGFRGNTGFSGKFGVWGGFGRFGASKGFAQIASLGWWGNLEREGRQAGNKENSMRGNLADFKEGNAGFGMT